MFILASSSPRRHELLEKAGLPFIAVKPQVEEQRRPGEPALDYARRLSSEKADAVAALHSPPVTVLAADTVVILAADTLGVLPDGAILEKPADADDARAMLRRLRGKAHTVCTAITLLRLRTDGAPERLTDTTCTTVYMRDYSDDEIEAYIATGDPFDKAGAYAIQHAGFHPVARIAGCYTNVVGLPVCAVLRALVQSGLLAVKGGVTCDDPRCTDPEG